ncbi:MAG TPA: SPOR domain-containing protein, partial [Rhizomicrobium sp.]
NRKLGATPPIAASVTTIATIKSDLPPPPPGAAPGILGVLSVSDSKTGHGAALASSGDKTPETVVASASTAEHAAKSRGGWMIQVGAFPDEHNAKERLSAAKAKAKELNQADPFTEKVAKGDKALYRARFAGLDKDQAENACKNLKLSEIPCILLKN